MAKGVKTGGRVAGTPNKASAEARQAIAMFVEKNASKLDLWLTKVADGDPENDIKPNPAKAFELFQSVVEYHIPKLNRTEVAGLLEVTHKAADLTDDQLAAIAARNNT